MERPSGLPHETFNRPVQVGSCSRQVVTNGVDERTDARRLADIAQEKRRLFRLMEGAANDAERRRLNWGRGDLQIEESKLLARLRRVSDR